MRICWTFPMYGRLLAVGIAEDLAFAGFPVAILFEYLVNFVKGIFVPFHRNDFTG